MALSVKKAAALLTSLLMMTASAAACGNKEDHHDDHNMVGNYSDGDYAEASERDLRPETDNVPVMITYCTAYLNEEEARKIAEFYYSISEKDPKYLESAVYPEVLSYKLDGDSSQDYLDAEYKYIKEKLIEDDFKFSVVTVDSQVTADDPCFEYDSLLKKAAPNAKVTDKKVLKVNCLYTKASSDGEYSLANRISEKQMADINVAVYTIDGKPYVIF